MPAPPLLRPPIRTWITGACIALAAVGVLVNLLNGNTTGSVWFAILTLVGVWLLLRPRFSRQRRVVNIWAPLVFAAIFLVAGIVATIAATQATGGARIAQTAFAVVFYACTAMGVFLAVVVHRYLHRPPPDEPTTDENEPDGINP